MPPLNPEDPSTGSAASRAEEARQALLARIGNFVETHDLAVTASNLAAICGGLSGSHPELAQAFAAREIAGEPIDQRWLDTLGRLDPDNHSRIAELEALMDKLEYSLMRFAQTARSAQSETSDHRGALGARIEAMAEIELDSAAAGDLAQVLDLSRTMLARIEQVESAMARSQAETERLRENLAKARLEADVDHLTGLPNRRAFERRLVSAAIEARAKGEKLSLGFCDVDRFKLINDNHGHEAGDRVLCAVAATLNEHAGDACFVARHGGEEFVLLFYGMDKQAARAKLDAIRLAQAARRLMNRDTGQPFGRVTFSGGVAEVTEDSDTRSALGRADAALYRAKQEGRNRVMVG
ncbi:sensor domain-containing diguanylate cyclase [Erythrobacter dokdonensis]|uniref:diguanylate cyclase n=1 Tax=Erythrobacter dokdonensis DSW-74 TaxID=1300349 RepID=A0A1A7BEL8_9SPHN|nr:GGDEF domain-containing protein [Erythrobacter dokdonensis]OBV10929.1 putative diguanylate cyclase [Erythrobacter dokdonensis DSW-74]